jgi:retron-type reverse transcriptase
MNMCFKVDHPHQLPNATDPYFKTTVQHGFRVNRSTTTAMTSLHSTWVKLKKRGQCVGIIAFDLSAAFDIVDHNLLVKNMNIYGVRETGSSIFSF